MKSTFDIPDEKLQEAMEHSRASNKREAVIEAIDQYNRLMRAQKVVATFGTFKNFMTQRELRASREHRAKRQKGQRRGAGR